MNNNVFPSSSSRIVKTSSGEFYEKPPISTGIAAGLAGLAVVKPVKKTILAPVMSFTRSQSVNLLNYSAAYEKAALDTFFHSELSKKGVKIFDAANASDETIRAVASEALPKFTKYLPEFIQNNVKNHLCKKLFVHKTGYNAAYLTASKTISVNISKHASALPHEIGHALISMSNGVDNFLQHLCIPGKFISAAILLLCVFKPVKPGGEKPHGNVDKAATYIKDNAGKLTFAAFLPTLAAEGLASAKGLKYIKPLLGASAYKNLKISYGINWLAYLILAIGSAAAVNAAKWVHDNLAEPKHV